jgi:hypothetical protein
MLAGSLGTMAIPAWKGKMMYHYQHILSAYYYGLPSILIYIVLTHVQIDTRLAGSAVRLPSGL